MSKDRIKSIIIRPANNGFRLDEFPVPDYIITMRKPGSNPEPISHGRGTDYRDPDPNEYVFEDMGKLCDWLKKRFA